MILFKDDWRLYPQSIIDMETTNTSFVRLANLYRSMGIENNAFHLSLLNPRLQGVDPHDPNISLEKQLMVSAECKLNPWYFFREVLRVPPITGNTPVSLEGNRANIALYWCFYNHAFTILIQPRQTGKSLSTDGLMIELMNIQCGNTQINLLTKDDTLRSRNIQRLKDIESELPYYLRQRTKADVNNTEELSVKSLGNSYKAHVPQKSAKMAYNVGRGLTSPIFHIDEGPFQSNISISLPAALAAGTRAREEAAAKGEPYGTIFTTTAGKKDDRDGKYCYGIVTEAAEWTEKFLDTANAADFEAMVRRSSRSSTKRGVFSVNITMNHRQLGKTDEWLVKSIEDAKVYGEDADRDFGNVWTSGTQSHPLPTNVLDVIRKSRQAEDHTTISKLGGYVTRWYIPEANKEYILANGKFVMSMDTSDASGGDDISLFLSDVRSGETIATGTFNETNLITLAEWICEWIVNNPNITVNIERRSSGATILDYLLLMLPARGIDPFKRLFNRIVNDADEDPERFKEIQLPMGRRSSDIYIRFKKAFGFATSGGGVTSRTELYSTTLQNAARKVGSKVKDLTTINQIAGLVTSNGRVDHQSGEHDDMIIAWLLNFWMLSSAKNLYFYGIEAKEILCYAIEKKELSAREAYELNEQAALRTEIERTYNQLKSENDEFVIQKLEHKLNFLDKQLVLQDNEKFSVDDLIKTLREDRRKRKSNSYNSYNRNNSVYNPYSNNKVYDSFANYKDPRSVF